MDHEPAEGQTPDGKFSSWERRCFQVFLVVLRRLLVVIFTPNGIYVSVEELQDILRDIDTY
jgi:hypothetical protein